MHMHNPDATKHNIYIDYYIIYILLGVDYIHIYITGMGDYI